MLDRSKKISFRAGTNEVNKTCAIAVTLIFNFVLYGYLLFNEQLQNKN